MTKKQPSKATPIPTWGIFASYATEAGNVVCMVANQRFGCLTTLRPHRALRFTTEKKAEAHRRKMLKAREKSPEPARYLCLTVFQLSLEEIRKSRTQHKRHVSDVQEEDRRDPGFPDPGPLDGGERGDDGGDGAARQQDEEGEEVWDPVPRGNRGNHIRHLESD